MIGPWHDISVALDAALPTWPGSPGVETRLRLSIEDGDVANVTQLEMDVHTGTHVDAPCHFIADGPSVDALGLEPLIGPAFVIDTGTAVEIDAGVLSAAAIPAGAERVLLRTSNSSRPSMYRTAFDESYAALTLDGAEWLARHGLRLVGIDYLSIQRYDESPDVHRALLAAGAALLEGLCLRDVAPGGYDLVCLPLKLTGVEAAPARAILVESSSEAACHG